MQQVDYVKILFCVALSALIGYVCYIIDGATIGNLLVPAITLALLTSFASIKYAKHNYMMKATMSVGIFAHIVTSFIFVIKIHNLEVMTVSLSLIVLIALALSYLIYKS